MAPMKRCPQCGKNVASDRTYCIGCGVTLGVRCPDCQAVSPVGSQACTACGHSFVQKKTFSLRPIREGLRKYAVILQFALPIFLLVLTLIAAGFPSVLFKQTVDDAPLIAHEITGYELMQHFLSGTPTSIERLQASYALSDVLPAVQALLYAAGAGWLLLLIGLLLAVCLASCNLTHMGKDTARRMFFPMGLSMGGMALLFTFVQILSVVLVDKLTISAPLTAVVVKETVAAFPIALLVVLCLGSALQIWLYADALRHVTVENELSLSRIFYIPFAFVARNIRKLWKKLTNRKKPAKNEEEDEPAFTVTPRFTTYILIFVVAIVFTQALLSKVSNIFFWFVFLLPLVLLVYVLLAARSLTVDMRTETVTIEKNTPQTYEFHIGNRSVLAIPFIDATVCIPQSNSVRCTERVVRMSMAPLTGYTMKNTVSFRFRGTYDIGVRYFYVYDFFRLFRVRVNVEDLATVYVMPRRMTPDDALAQAISDSTVRTVRAPLVVDKLEVSDIRDYQNGDPLKSIHWKLSSKSETFIVKDYNTGTANQTVIFCDLCPHFPDEPPALPEPAPEPRRERRSARRVSRRERREEERLEMDRRAKNTRVRVDRETHTLTDEELTARLDQRAAAAEFSGRREEEGADTAPDTATETATRRIPADVHELSDPAYYDDMNEYLADGVVELTIAMVLSELRQGHEVLLLWFDRRSESGICSYALRSVEEFENIYHLFATAPLCDLSRKSIVSDYDVTALTAMTAHLQSVKQLFVVPTMDATMLSNLIAMPGVAEAGNAGSTEVILYTPEERFRYPVERASYLAGCREQLASHGISLTAGSFNISPLSPTTSEGGTPHEA